MKHLFVPYEIALLAKEKGFDEPCFTTFFYDKTGIIDVCIINNLENVEVTNSKLDDEEVAAPLYQQLVDWFREEHKIVIWVETSLSISHWNYRFKIESEDDKKEGHKTSDYYQALNAALTEAFKLINP